MGCEAAFSATSGSLGSRDPRLLVSFNALSAAYGVTLFRASHFRVNLSASAALVELSLCQRIFRSFRRQIRLPRDRRSTLCVAE